MVLCEIVPSQNYYSKFYRYKTKITENLNHSHNKYYKSIYTCDSNINLKIKYNISNVITYNI